MPGTKAAAHPQGRSPATLLLSQCFPGIPPFMKCCMTFDDKRVLHEKTHGCAQWTEHICAPPMPSTPTPSTRS
jgi:hypothetical protein